MPDRARVESFVATVVRGDYVQALADFYCEDASMQENDQPPRRGRDHLVQHETKTLATMQRMHTHPAPTFLVDGDFVAINWRFDFTDTTGITRRMEELSLQRWRGDRIAEERFFYDPKSIRPLDAAPQAAAEKR
jgi:ketosteroid isomerase-like protein